MDNNTANNNLGVRTSVPINWNKLVKADIKASATEQQKADKILQAKIRKAQADEKRRAAEQLKAEKATAKTLKRRKVGITTSTAGWKLPSQIQPSKTYNV